jgi:hypothetical protein
MDISTGCFDSHADYLITASTQSAAPIPAEQARTIQRLVNDNCNNRGLLDSRLQIRGAANADMITAAITPPITPPAS